MDARRPLAFFVTLALFTLGASQTALAGVAISFYLGASQTARSDLRVVQSSRGNDATLHSAPWPGYPFRFEPYYGVRLTYTPPGHPSERVVLDYTHYKTYARTEDSVEQSGTWHGTAFQTTGPMNERVQSFEMTHGLNMIGVTYVHVFAAGGNGVYAGVGPVMYVPHTESTVDGLRANARFDFAGLGFQTVGGVSTCVGNRQVFFELKYNSGHPQVSIADGYAQTTLHTIHELAGFTFGPCISR